MKCHQLVRLIQDMEDNRVLGALLRGDYGDMSKTAAEEVLAKWVQWPSAPLSLVEKL